MENKKAIIAMSGGVDSSVAAYLIKEKGYEIIGATMKLYNNEDIGESKEKTCCSLDDVYDARSVANNLGIPFYVFNYSDEFKKRVIENFIETYENGGTPNPCIECNKYLKFSKLIDRADEIGFDYVVTGHYARTEYDEKSGRYLLKKAKDDTKDQTYMLYSLNQYQLSRIMFPLGDYKKNEIRDIAERLGFVNSRKKDSQDICFVPDGDYKRFIESYRNKKYKSGNFVDSEGNVLGTHNGIIGYTVGQRKGLGLSLKCPMYVIKKDIKSNSVVLGYNKDLYKNTLIASDTNYIPFDKLEGDMRVTAKTRYSHKAAPAVISPLSDNRVLVTFDEPQRAITRGQAVVFYDGDIVVGGGTIE